MNQSQIQFRERQLAEWAKELKAKVQVARTKSVGAAQDKALDAVGDEYEEFKAERAYLEEQKGQLVRSEALMARMRGEGAGQYDGPTDVNQTDSWIAPSPLNLPAEAYEQLFEAASKKLPSFRMEFSGKDFKRAQVKSPIAGGAPSMGSTGLFPPVQVPNLTQALPYEPNRLFTEFIGASMDGPAVEYLAHSGNTNPAAYVAELGQKPDLGMQLTKHIVTPTKVAALASVSTEALQDFREFLSFVPSELSRAIVDAETNLVVNGTGATGVLPGMTGILNTSGTLTRAVASGQTPLDCMQLAFNDLRIGTSFATANLVAMHPTTWTYLRSQKDSMGRYLLAADPATGQVDTIWGVRMVVNTYIPEGTALVFDTSKAVLAWTRQGMSLEINQNDTYSWQNNAVSFRCEERIAIGVQRPTAVNIVTGLEAA
ncbi:phage major capsid protein [Mycobacterium sp. HM-7]